MPQKKDGDTIHGERTARELALSVQVTTLTRAYSDESNRADHAHAGRLRALLALRELRYRYARLVIKHAALVAESEAARKYAREHRKAHSGELFEMGDGRKVSKKGKVE